MPWQISTRPEVRNSPPSWALRQCPCRAQGLRHLSRRRQHDCRASCTSAGSPSIQTSLDEESKALLGRGLQCPIHRPSWGALAIICKCNFSSNINSCLEKQTLANRNTWAHSYIATNPSKRIFTGLGSRPSPEPRKKTPWGMHAVPEYPSPTTTATTLSVF